jgi:hypothetical protein
VLKGISVNEFMETMGFFSAALGYNCTNCHVEESLQSWAKFADDIPAKRRARGMILMVNSFNKNNFGGKRALDANLSFPGGIKQSLGRWRAGFPSTLIDDREVDVVEGTASQGTRVKLFFDKESGLLARLVRYTDTVVGFVPTQIDYSDYREVSGVKMPFKWTLTWTDGQSATELSDVRANVPVDAAKFTSPPVPATPRSRTAPR